MNSTAESFAENRYVALPALVSAAAVRFFCDYACKLAAGGKMKAGDATVPGAPAVHGDPFLDLLLEKLTSRIEGISGLDLFPTYSYVRVYRRGDSLPPHTDRPACEVSLSLCLGLEADRPWPLWIEGRSGPVAVSLAAGDGLLYRGLECRHWREPFDGQRMVQAFLHWVERRGPCAGWRFDKRAGLTPFPEHLKPFFPL